MPTTSHTNLPLIALYIVAIATTFWLVSGFLAPLLLAAIVASIFLKVKHTLPNWLKGNANLFAAFSTVTTLLVIIVPLLLLMVLMGLEAINFVNFVQGILNSEGFDMMLGSLYGLESQTNSFLEPLNMQVSLDSAREYVSSSVQVFGSLLYNNAAAIMANLASIAINIFFFLFITFFLVRDGESIIENVKALLPFEKKEAQSLVDAVEHVGQTVIVGSILSSLVMGVIMTMVFWLFGFTSPILWGLTIAFLSLIPLLGTWAVYLPSIAFLFFSQPWWVALLFLIVVLFLDSFLFYAVIRPKFLDSKTQLYPLAIFLAIVGGITTFGPMGIVYGPCIMAIFITLMRHSLQLRAMVKK